MARAPCLFGAPCCAALCHAEHVELCAVQVLPRDIRVLGWTDVPEDFSARQVSVSFQLRLGSVVCHNHPLHAQLESKSRQTQGGWLTSGCAYHKP